MYHEAFRSIQFSLGLLTPEKYYSTPTACKNPFPVQTYMWMCVMFYQLNGEDNIKRESELPQGY